MGFGVKLGHTLRQEAEAFLHFEDFHRAVRSNREQRNQVPHPWQPSPTLILARRQVLPKTNLDWACRKTVWQKIFAKNF